MFILSKFNILGKSYCKRIKGEVNLVETTQIRLQKMKNVAKVSFCLVSKIWRKWYCVVIRRGK